LKPAPPLPTMALVALAGCNGVFGLDPVAVRDAGPDGGGGDGGAPVVSGLLACTDAGGFDSGLVVNGGFESDEPDQAWTPEVIGSAVTTIDPCEGAHALRVNGWYADKGRVYNDVTPLPFAIDPCVDFSFWARAKAGEATYRIWITFNAEGPPGYEPNDLSPPDGFVASSATWTRVAGRCRARVPDVIHGFSQVAIRAALDQTVDLDALTVLAVACRGDEFDCPLPP
jgi:hypothetical protein